MLASGERFDPPPSLSIAARFEFEHDSPRNMEGGVLDDSDRLLTACSDKVQAVIPITSGAITMFFPEDSTLLAMPQVRRKKFKA
jgi:hypothetical protein